MPNLKYIFRFLFRRPEVEQELSSELQYHLDRQIEINLQHGMSPEEARRAARLAVGGIEPLKEECREARFGRSIETLAQDIRYGFRVLRKSPGYTAATIVTLALGIGANTAIFSLIYGVFLRPLPYNKGSQLVVLHQHANQANGELNFSPLEIKDYSDHNHTLDGVVEHHQMAFLLIDKNSAERVSTSVVSVNFFDVLGVKPLLGRTFLPSDNDPSQGAVLVLSYKYWQAHEGGDTSIVGRVFRMNNLPHRVIGVLPPIPQYPVESDVYMPTWQCPSRSNPQNIANRNFRLMSAVFGRLKPGVRPEQAQADLSMVVSDFAKADPAAYPPNAGFGVKLDTLHEDLTRDARTAFLILLGVSGFVLLVACANVANLMLARLIKLERELAVRTALGAGRFRLMRQLLTESVLLSIAGGALGLAMAPPALRALATFATRFTPRANEVQLDAPVLLFTFGVSLLTGLVFGLVPALTRWGNAADALQQGGRTTTSRGRQVLRSSLVIAQVTVSCVLLAGAGLMIRSFLKLGAVNPGFDPSSLLSMRISGAGHFTNPRERRETITRRVLAVGGVESVAWVSNAPFSPFGIINGPGNTDFEIEGRPNSKANLAPTVDTTFVDAHYFKTVRQPLVKGRYIDERDTPETPPVAVINQTMARHRWPTEDPIGKRISFNFNRTKTWFTVQGIVSDAREYGLDRAPLDEVYMSVDQTGFGSVLVVRSIIDPDALLAGVRAAIREVDPFLALDQVGTMRRMEYESLASPRLMTILLGLFALLAVLISAGGIAAVMALTVSQRTHELGVRLALGARHGAIIGMVVRQGLILAIIGTIIGIAAGGALARLLSTLLYATSPTDTMTFLAASCFFLLVAAFACFIPARQITNIDPLNALRQE